jgi:hypothetical protein
MLEIERRGRLARFNQIGLLQFSRLKAPDQQLNQTTRLWFRHHLEGFD